MEVGLAHGRNGPRLLDAIKGQSGTKNGSFYVGGKSGFNSQSLDYKSILVCDD